MTGFTEHFFDEIDRLLEKRALMVPKKAFKMPRWAAPTASAVGATAGLSVVGDQAIALYNRLQSALARRVADKKRKKRKKRRK